MPVNIFDDDGDDVWDEAFGEVFFGEIPVEAAPCPYYPGRVETEPSYSSRVETAPSYPARVERCN